MPKVSAATKEAREKVKRVMVLTWGAAALVLLDTFVAVLVVDFASFFNDKDLIGFCYVDKLLLGIFVAAVVKSVIY